MGSFNTIACISKLPIYSGDKVVCFLAKTYNGVGHRACHTCERVSPIFIPFEASYYDYGMATSMKKSDAVVRLIEGIFNAKIKDIIEIFSTDIHNREYSVFKDEDGTFTTLVRSLFNGILINGTIEEWLDSICMCYEHYDMYKLYAREDTNNASECYWYPNNKNLLIIYLSKLLGLRYDLETKQCYHSESLISVQFGEQTTFYVSGEVNQICSPDISVTEIMTVWNNIAKELGKGVIFQRKGVNRAIIEMCELVSREYNGAVFSTENIKMMMCLFTVQSFLFKEIRGFIFKEELLTNYEIINSTVEFADAMYNISMCDIYFGNSEYGNQSFEYGKLIEFETAKLKLLKQLQEENED